MRSDNFRFLLTHPELQCRCSEILDEIFIVELISSKFFEPIFFTLLWTLAPMSSHDHENVVLSYLHAMEVECFLS